MQKKTHLTKNASENSSNIRIFAKNKIIVSIKCVNN